MTKFVRQQVETIEKPITAWALVAVSLTLVVMYAYLVNASIVNIVAAKAVRAEASALTARVGALEAAYLAAKSSLTVEDARALGFSESKSQTSYITRGPSLGSLSLNR